MKTSLLFVVTLFTAAAAAAATADNLADAITKGQPSINLRLRYEGVDQTGLRDAEALTLRTRLGFTTASLHGWKAMLEAENITAYDGDRYSQAGINPGGAGRAVVADPEGTELNQAWLACTADGTTVTAGRQRLVLDNARFVGDSGWRQNAQTFDAVAVQNKSLDKTTLTYAYLDRIARVFGDHHAQGRWQSDSHLFNASYTGFAPGTFTGYAYLLDFANAAANSCATYGASFAGSHALNPDAKLLYRFEYARQSDYASSPLSYATNYSVIELGGGGKPGSFTLGREALGSDRNVGFKTPPATLHAFNGWADLFNATPATGLRDTYLKATATLPEKISLLAFYHRYEADTTGANLGHEWDVQLSRALNKNFTALIKYADFTRDLPTLPNVSKLWFQLEYAL